ncbi:Gp37 family protein [Chitinophaga sp. sic0106]|uniref:Gp37 family protein n=1 Tax=Chitinophaga sp. sic0106 TaxID=2854785 RepID=UPI001C46FD7A|nr:Gp37 family protein [Chitinophaga sp. sic0106]MBV7529032.1 Gp37 family protein [Chitinophaga sp. sic0106]
MNIYPIQQSIVAHLQQSFASVGVPFLAKDLPEKEADFDRGVSVPNVYVIYSGSQADKSSSTNTIAQNRRLQFNVEVNARKLYGTTGLFVVRDIVEQALIGFLPTNCQRLYLIRDDISQTDDRDIWIHVFQMECVTMLIQKEENEVIIVPSFQEIIAKEE